MTKKIKCWKCKFFKISEEDIPYCLKLGVLLTNGYLMEFHSERCSELNKEVEERKQ